MVHVEIRTSLGSNFLLPQSVSWIKLKSLGLHRRATLHAEPSHWPSTWCFKTGSLHSSLRSPRASQWVSRLCLSLPSPSEHGLQACCSLFYVTAGDQNSGPHSRVAGILPTEALSSPNYYFGNNVQHLFSNAMCFKTFKSELDLFYNEKNWIMTLKPFLCAIM